MAITVASGRKTLKDTSAADTFNIGGDATSVTIAGKMKAGDIINVEGLASEYKATASGRTITLKSDTQTIKFQLDSAAGAASIRFLDGDLTATYAGAKAGAKLGTQKLGAKAVEVDDSALGSSDSSAVDYSAAASGGSSSGGSSSGGSSSGGSSSATGTTFSLSTSADILNPNSTTAANKTTGGNDTFYALTDQSFTSADIIDGGEGTDSLIAQYATAVTSNSPVLTSVENVTLRQSGNADLTFSGANATGLKNLTFDQISDNTATKAATATALGAGVAIGITNHTSDDSDTYTFTYTDAALAGASDSVTLNVTGISATTGLVTIKNTSSTASGSGAETVSIVTSGTGTAAASTLADLDSFDGGGTTSVLKTLNVSGTSDLTITASIDFAGSTSGTINASGMTGAATLVASGGESITLTGAGTGGITLTTGAGNDNLTGGTGDDTFTIGAGFDTVVGGAGNDRVVVTAITDLTANDSVSLGDGSRDTLAIGTWTSLSATELTTANKATIAATGAEVIELTAAMAATAIDYAEVVPAIVRVSGGLATGAGNVTVTNVSSGDTLIVTADMEAKTAAAAIAASGALPGQTYKIELYGAGIDVKGLITAATDHGIELSSGISTLVIDSSKASTVTTTTANTIGGAIHASAFAIKNTSASNVTITGNHDLTIANTTANGIAFGSAVNLDATAFTGALTLGGSASADILKGGIGNDVLTAAGGNDSIDLSAGGDDKLVFGSDTGNGTDTITGFGSTDKVNIAALGAGSMTTLTSVISSAAAQEATADNTAYIINTSGAAANLTTSGTAVVTDWTTLSQVASYLGERFSLAGGNDEAVFVVNVSGTSTTYIYSMVDTDNTLAAADLALVGVITRAGVLDSANVVFA